MTPHSKPSTPPPLDTALAADCKELSKPLPDYDAWLQWVVTEVLPAYTDCAVRHAETVQAWPKAQSVSDK